MSTVTESKNMSKETKKAISKLMRKYERTIEKYSHRATDEKLSDEMREYYRKSAALDREALQEILKCV